MDRAGATGCRAAQVAFIARTVRRAPEVMIKMLNRGGRDLGSVARHLKYLDREGELPIETDEGDPLKGKGVSKALLDDWDLELDAKRPPYGGPQAAADGQASRSWCTR